MNELLSTIPVYLTKQISDMISADPSIINLSIGEPWFTPPEKLYDHLRTQFSDRELYDKIPHRYADSRGLLQLRKEIAGRYRRLYGAAIDPGTEILVTHGASEAIWLSIMTLTSIGDEVIIPDPAYVMYETAVKVLGRTPVRLASHPNDGFRWNTSDLLEAISSKTKLIIINSPGNPTGSVYGSELIQRIHSLARKQGIYLVHDEVYESYVYNGDHANMFSYRSEPDQYCVLINGFSKTYSMMGWRLGWMIGSKDFISNATRLHTNLTLNLGSFHQQAASCLLNDPEVDTEMRKYSRQLGRNIELLRQSLSQCYGFEFQPIDTNGGFFLFPNISRLYEIIPEEYRSAVTRGEAVSQYLLKEAKVGVIPGVIYGENCRDHIRISVTAPTDAVLLAAQRIKSCIGSSEKMKVHGN